MVPLIYIPTEVVFLDDSSTFLYTLGTCVSLEKNIYSFFADPKAAFTYITNSKKSVDSIDKFLGKQDKMSYSSVDSKYDFLHLHEEIFSKQRFNVISIVVADYSMPTMNGLDFLAQITDPHIKKILLTGEADEKIAVDAFNKQAISAYVKKTTPNYLEAIKESIHYLSKQFWNEKLQLPSQVLQLTSAGTPFTSKEFETYFDALVKEYDVVEYYLLDGSFRYLMASSKGNLYTLWIQSIEEADSFYYDIQSLDEEEFPEKIKQEAKAYQKMFCGHSSNGSLPDIREWSKYYREASKVGNFLVSIAPADELEHAIYPFEDKRNTHSSFQFTSN